MGAPPGPRRRRRHPRRAPRPRAKRLATRGHEAGRSPAVTRGSQQESHSIKVPRQTGAVWVPDGILLTSWCGKQVSNLPRVIGRAQGRAQTTPLASRVPGEILSQACSSQPRLGRGRPSPPHARSAQVGVRWPRPRTREPSRLAQAAGHASPRVRTASPRSLSAPSAPPSGRPGRLVPAEPYEPPGGTVPARRFWLISGRGCLRLPAPPTLAQKDSEARRSPCRRGWARWQRAPSSDPASAMWLSLLLLLAVLLLTVLCKGHLRLYAGSSPNPFSEDVRRPPAPLVTDKEARKKVLKRGQREGTLGSKAALGRLAFLFQEGELLSTWASVSPYVKCWEGFLAPAGAPPYCLLPVRTYALAGPGP